MTVKMTRYTVYHYRRYIALDERAYIIDEFIGHVGTVLVYPLAWNEFFVICDLVNILYFCSTLIRIIGQTFENNHLSGISFIGSLDSSAAYLRCFQNIDTGCTVGCGTLERTQLNGTGLASELACNIACKVIRCTGELLMSESIYKVYALAKFAYIAAVRETDTFGNSDYYG